jgi:hypothetical protein
MPTCGAVIPDDFLHQFIGLAGESFRLFSVASRATVTALCLRCSSSFALWAAHSQLLPRIGQAHPFLLTSGQDKLAQLATDLLPLAWFCNGVMSMPKVPKSINTDEPTRRAITVRWTT